MICQRCRLAGKYNKAEAPKMAATLHEECEAPTTCPCQHQSTGVNWNLIQLETRRDESLSRRPDARVS